MTTESIDLFEEALKNATHTAAETTHESILDVTSQDKDCGHSELCTEEISKSNSKSSSDIDTSTDDTSSDEEQNLSNCEEADIVDDDDEDVGLHGPITSAHELLEEPIPNLPDDFKIDKDSTIHEIGTMKSAFDYNIIIEASLSGEQRVLKEGSILCLEDRTLIGPLCEVFGQLKSPFYRVSFSRDENSTVSFNNLKSFIGSKVFYLVPEAHWIDTFQLKQVKGTDASNGFDEELPEYEQEFSDDEKEMEFKRQKKLAKKRKHKDDNNSTENGEAAYKIKSQSKSTISYKSRNARSQGNGYTNGRARNESIVGNQKEVPSKSTPLSAPPGFHQALATIKQPMTYQNQQQYEPVYQSQNSTIYPLFGNAASPSQYESPPQQLTSTKPTNSYSYIEKSPLNQQQMSKNPSQMTKPNTVSINKHAYPGPPCSQPQTNAYQPGIYQPGYQQIGHQQVYQQPVYQQPIYQQPVYQQPVYQQPVYQQPVYQQPIYQQPGYQQPTYQQPGYQQPGYQQPGYQQPGYQQPTYQQPGYQNSGYEHPRNPKEENELEGNKR